MTRAQFFVPESFKEPGLQYPWIGGLSYPVYVPAQMRVLNDPKEAFEAFALSFNELFLKDLLKELGSVTGKKVTDALPGDRGPTRTEGQDWFQRKGSAKETTMTPETVAEAVKGYPEAPLAMAIVADRFSKEEEIGCMWPVVYDATRTVLWTKRMCGETSGLGLRNYYFGPFKEVVDDIKGVRKKEW